MTPDKATALWAAAKDGAWAERRRGARGYAELSEIAKINRFRALADPPTILALLEERERLLKERDDAVRAVRDLISTYPDGWCPPLPLMVRAAASIARQTPEAST